MKKQHLVILVFVLLVCTVGCSPMPVERPGSKPTSTIQVTSTNTDGPTLLNSAPDNLQITYIQIDEAINAEFFAIDVACFDAEVLCFGEPTSLFKISYGTDTNSKEPSGLVTQYDWTPDGSKIALSAKKDLFIGDINTQSWANITNSPDIEEYHPKWSSDGKNIYYLSCSRELGYGFCKLARFDLAERVTSIVLTATAEHVDVFAVSPDGQTVVFNSSQFLYQSNFDGSEIRQITSANIEEKSPYFSPDGRMIAFVRTDAPTLTGGSDLVSDIIVRTLDSGEEKNLTEEFDDEAGSPFFSPDGKWVAFEGFGLDRVFNIYIVSIERKEIIQVTQGDIDRLSPSWRVFTGH